MTNTGEEGVKTVDDGFLFFVFAFKGPSVGGVQVDNDEDFTESMGFVHSEEVECPKIIWSKTFLRGKDHVFSDLFGFVNLATETAWNNIEDLGVKFINQVAFFEN